MRPNLLVLAGTTEARHLCSALADAKLPGVVSLAGRVRRPAPLGLPTRVGGFGGAVGLKQYLRENAVTHVIDASHPFAARISLNAINACAQTGVPLIALTRPPWREQDGDSWTYAPDIEGAVAALAGRRKRIMLAVGRMHLSDFAANPQHFYLLRLVDPPEVPLEFPDAHIILDRGPFALDRDLALLKEHRIEQVVSKNSGGMGAYSKIAAARALGLPVLMIDRPAMPSRSEAHSVDEVMRWLSHAEADLGV